MIELVFCHFWSILPVSFFNCRNQAVYPFHTTTNLHGIFACLLTCRRDGILKIVSWNKHKKRWSDPHPICMFPILRYFKPNAFFHIPFIYNVVPISAPPVTNSLPPSCRDVLGTSSSFSFTSPLTGTSNSTANPRLGTAEALPYLTYMDKMISFNCKLFVTLPPVNVALIYVTLIST